MINMNNLYYFNVLAKYQHYTKAAEYLYITQPSLSHAIAHLEEEYGVKLFEKDGRNIKLSKYGKLLYEYTAPAFEGLNKGNHLLQRFSVNEMGIVDFSFLLIFGYKQIPELIKHFREQYQYEKININMHQSTSEDSIQGLKEGKYDLSLIPFVENEPDIEFVPVFNQQLVCVVSLDHPLARLDSITIEQMAGYQLIKYTDKVGEIPRIINHLFESQNLKPSICMRFKEELTMAAFAASGHQGCIAIIPDLEILDSMPIKKIKIQHPDAHRNIYIATLKNRPIPGCVKSFYNYLCEYFRVSNFQNS